MLRKLARIRAIHKTAIHPSCAMSDDVYVVSKYDYTALDPVELSFKKGDRFKVIDDSKQWWKLENLNGDVGFVPSNFFRKETIVDKAKNGVKALGYPSTTRNSLTNGNGYIDATKSCVSNHNHAQSSSNGGGFMAVASATIAIAKYNYEPTRGDELRLTRGDNVRVLEQSSDGWWNGELNGQKGWFPSNYVEVAPVTTNGYGSGGGGGHGDANGFGETHNGTRIFETVQTLYNFDAQTPEELSFRQNEMLTIVEHPEHDPEWWRARNASGQVGLIPTNYIKVVSGGTGSGSGGANGGSASSAPTNGNGQVLTGPYAGQAWYFGLLSRQQSENLLNAKGHDGDFLVRDSESNIGDYSISLKGPQRIMHFRIQVTGSNFCIGPRSFASMDQLIMHYMKSPIFNDEQTGETLYLVRPLSR